MTCAVVAYPTLDEVDRRWIEAIRARHDPQASRVHAHFTLVFPTRTARGPLLAHVAARLAGSRRIAFVLRHAAPFPEPVGPGCHVFLVPEEGRRELIAIHERLSEGMAAPDPPAAGRFVPHVTVGACPSLARGERLADEINADARVVRGTIDRVDLVEVDEDRVRTVADMRLGRQ